jgi:hypothetical protein
MSDDGVPFNWMFTETTLLCVALAIALGFVVLLIIDNRKRKRRQRHHFRTPPPETLGQKLRKPLDTWQALRQAFRHARRRRSRIKRWEEKQQQRTHR